MRLFKRPVEFILTDRKAHVRVWLGHSLTACGKHVEFTDGRLVYNGHTYVDFVHPICCKSCIKARSEEAA